MRMLNQPQTWRKRKSQNLSSKSNLISTRYISGGLFLTLPTPSPLITIPGVKCVSLKKKNFFFKVIIISLSPKAGERAGRAGGARQPHPRAAPWAAAGTRDPGCRRLGASSRAPRSLRLPLHVVKINSLLSSSVTP